MSKMYCKRKSLKWIISLIIIVYYISIFFLWEIQCYASATSPKDFDIEGIPSHEKRENLSFVTDLPSDYTLENFPFRNMKASKFINLYKEALENENDLIALEADLVQRGLNGQIVRVYRYKTTDNLYKKYYYYGDIKDGKPSGQGIVFMGNTPLYIGNFSKGYPSGYGIELTFKYEFEYGGHVLYVVYEGEWKKGEYSGDGVKYFNGTNLYYIEQVDSNVINQIKEAVTKFDETLNEESEIRTLRNWIVDTQGIVSYDGSFKNGKPSGKGNSYMMTESYGKNGLLYEGEWKKGDYDGIGTLYHINGNIKYKGHWKNGKYDGKGTLYKEDGSIEFKGKFKKGAIYN